MGDIVKVVRLSGIEGSDYGNMQHNVTAESNDV
jgi:hypothetical protein